MKIRQYPFKLKLDDGAGRGDGIHVSDIIRALAFKFGHLRPEFEGEEINANMVCPGLAWEEWLAPQIKEEFPSFKFHPGEMCVDGIYMNCDGISRKKSGLVIVHEIKFTWKSMRKAIEDEWMWLTQLAAYCKAYGTTVGMIWPYYVNGTYNFDMKESRIKPHRIEWTQEEIDENWDMLRNYADVMGGSKGRKVEKAKHRRSNLLTVR